MIYMQGECFASSSTVRNFELVVYAFTEFLTTGNLSDELLS
ncbi:hypothetical protein SALWKB12_0969 [Snodgrassella communis]|uniref:Uncharacterized protein n=1 Tax=Snodgrassella communis TaxID=2946699 RepID=A0A836Z5X8_9NEIS|nr:hypothetical protein SALWKB12_0969 [Snodgrassella communis]KDN15564.1 hypothetical protein SALWKB29_0668 [Snodgrassella communis]